jgi:hypothetical protein
MTAIPAHRIEPFLGQSDQALGRMICGFGVEVWISMARWTDLHGNLVQDLLTLT